ncbi:NACHT domain-containing protein [Kitasatospora sp. NPDC085464]|uniref:NACHT domain-containing protein n=1 Tax=Kitasatospora sp. NPDC085464 TaxID=3364063 RepID=UPI0037C9EA65
MTSNRFSGGQARTVHQTEVINLYGGPQPTTTDPDARRLALAVARQWRDEAAARGLFDPVPLPVPWRADRHLADRTELAGALPEASSADLAAFAKAFLALPERRQVVLGDAGSGKTSLAVLLLLALIDRLGPDDPVPVLVPLAPWNPARQGLRDWLAERLRKDYPSLPVPRLPAEGRVLPVLDGFDELPPAQQAPAFRLLNRTLAAGDPVVLTSRTDEYRQAAKEARVLDSSAAVRARPITPAGVAEIDPEARRAAVVDDQPVRGSWLIRGNDRKWITGRDHRPGRPPARRPGREIRDPTHAPRTGPYGRYTYGVVVLSRTKPRRWRMGRLSSLASTWRYR